jgi:hypothetical protein
VCAVSVQSSARLPRLRMEAVPPAVCLLSSLLLTPPFPASAPPLPALCPRPSPEARLSDRPAQGLPLAPACLVHLGSALQRLSPARPVSASLPPPPPLVWSTTQRGPCQVVARYALVPRGLPPLVLRATMVPRPRPVTSMADLTRLGHRSAAERPPARRWSSRWQARRRLGTHSLLATTCPERCLLLPWRPFQVKMPRAFGQT